MAISAFGGIANGCFNCGNKDGAHMGSRMPTTLAFADILVSVGLALLAAYSGKLGWSADIKTMLIAGSAVNLLMILFKNIVPIHESLLAQSIQKRTG